MRLLLVVPRLFNSNDQSFVYSFPLGLAYISAVLKQAGHEVDCFNLSHYRGTVDELIAERLKAGHPYDYLLTGGIATDYNQIKKISAAVHQTEPRPGLIIGGGIISSEPELMFRALRLDYAVIGEGEETVCELLTCLAERGELSAVSGLGYQDADGKFVCTKPRSYIKGIDALPWPDLEGLEYETYLDHMLPSHENWYDLYDRPRVYPIICSRSCPFLCTFCFHPLGRKYRQRSVDSVMRELTDRVKKYRINIIAIYDDLFSNDRVWLAEFCRRIKSFLAELPWECKWFCQMRVIDVDEEVLKTMKDAGCYLVSYGFESYSPRVLKSMKKPITPQQIDRAIKLTLKQRISLQGNFIFGDLAETPQTVKETLDYFRANREAGLGLGFINPYPGSHIYQECVRRGVIKDKLDFISNHIFDAINMTETMNQRQYSRMWLAVLRARAWDRIKCRQGSIEQTADGTPIVRARCPHCGAMNEYRNYYFPSRLFFNRGFYCRTCRYRFYFISFLYDWLEKLLVFIGGLMPVATYWFTRKVLPLMKRSRKILGGK
jgi:anaerobic magnesium-protoporphyrin IX monomethyl ester cyclase